MNLSKYTSKSFVALVIFRPPPPPPPSPSHFCHASALSSCCALYPSLHMPPIPGHAHHLYTENLILNTIVLVFFPLVILYREFYGKYNFVFYFTNTVKLRAACGRGEFLIWKNLWKIFLQSKHSIHS